MLELVARAFEYFDEQRKKEKPSHELVIISFDQRNHGHRMLDVAKNWSWGPKGSYDGGNDTHAMDMYGHFTGTAKDISFLIDFLPPYLYPMDERTIDLWTAAGVSLGGHATWVALANEPRLTVGIPIIGAPNFIPLFQRRAEERGTPFGPPFMPNSMLRLMERLDPAKQPNKLNEPGNPYVGKKILVLSGAEDKSVPHSVSAAWIDELEVGPSGVKEVWVQESKGHETTPEMGDRMAQFLWKHALGPA
ncbi:hypothetical protein DACRYDRAFT_72347 [Dacryopinax primogenitus]|uniref:Alpha/beta-hydrolase n=1 Tax=Dacryopinax primogenitus (strain DJM 731) TaxID=1858805 RepID=M5FNH3_DACPD|nr:uncharacterized protein DACRYDRAFT_72347 [Dacryopinax primogenitus]EJT97445.1 hypothetical protein DACRYDRAFT_72347 [Dacryopinax primogenitus]